MISVSTWISFTDLSEENKSWTKNADGYWYGKMQKKKAWKVCVMLCTNTQKQTTNKFKDYDPIGESSYLMQLDFTRFYGKAMQQKIFVNGFKWRNNAGNFCKDCIQNYCQNSEKGYILEVDGGYPQELHKAHTELPLLPVRMKIGQ